MRVRSFVLAILVASCGSEPRNGFSVRPSGADETLSPPSLGDRDAPADGPPRDCAQANATHSYVGCDYWPTVTGNPVWSIFDFAVAVANTGDVTANVVVTGPGGVHIEETVEPGALRKIYLPWVRDLKGPDWDECTNATKLLETSVIARKGAYHLVSSSPVVVYQFNALEFKSAGGPSGKDWATCPGSTRACKGNATDPGAKAGCFSFSNDASLLLPTSALTGSYRILGQRGWTELGLVGLGVGPVGFAGPFFAITATADRTTVVIKLAATARVRGGGGVASAAAGTEMTLSLDAGDVAEIVGEKGDTVDMSGSLVAADKPVQVLTGIPCINHPQGVGACDHLEESVFPAETLGAHYVVTAPTGPRGATVGHIVRFYGNADGTTLSYAPSRPPKCPATLAAGEVADCGIVDTSFEVSASHEIGIASFMLGGRMVDPPAANDETHLSLGDPSQTLLVAVEQFRKKYVFLAPDDYDESWVDVVGPEGADVKIDGTPVVAPFHGIGTSGVRRVKLGAGRGGVHTLEASTPVGIQVLGYGGNTSYEYPGGLDLRKIAPAPVK